MSERVLHEFDHGFGRFAVVDGGHATALRQIGGRPVDLYHGLDGRVLLDEVLRLRALLVEVARHCLCDENCDHLHDGIVFTMEPALEGRIRDELRGGESDG